MTASEWVGALKYAVRHVAGLQGLSLWQQLQLILLKLVAIAGYHYGKWQARVTPCSDDRSQENSQLLDNRVLSLLNG